MAEIIILLLIANLIGITASASWRGQFNWWLLGRPTVILCRDGQMKTSVVRSMGPHYWVAWYWGIEKIKLRDDGTAIAPPFRYTWEPLIPKNRDWLKTEAPAGAC